MPLYAYVFVLMAGSGLLLRAAFEKGFGGF